MLLAHAELLALPLAFRDNHGTQHPAAPSPEPGQQQALRKQTGFLEQGSCCYPAIFCAMDFQTLRLNLIQNYRSYS